MESTPRYNDFVVKFANVNGSGSASANGLFARAILRMGVPVAARNIFPSNIQGLPTWYEVRVVADGWRGRRGGVDLAVAMNPQTWDKDVAELDSGGYLFYDSTKPLAPSRFRDDVTTLGMPLTAICNAEYTDARQRQLFKNIIYLGALSALLDIDPAEIEKLFGEQYKGKEALLESNRKAFRMGIVGSHAFAHKLDAHVMGVALGPSAYESVPPETFGNSRHVGLGRLSGRNAVSARLRQLGLNVDDDALVEALAAEVRATAEGQSAPIGDEQLLAMLEKLKSAA